MTHKIALMIACVVMAFAAVMTAGNKEIPEYVGSQVCLGCHAEKLKLTGQP